MKKVKVLEITDLKKGEDKDYTSAQVNILQNVVNIDKDTVVEHLGNTFVVETEYVVDKDTINNAVSAGARKLEMYRTSFNIEASEEIVGKVHGKWVGIPQHDLAYFGEENAAKTCESLLED
jgi:predicted rRNA methylase YqxC with S4 and FtsJ domains